MNNEKKLTPIKLFLPVFIIGLTGSLIISVTDSFTKDRIALNKQATTIEILEAVMPLTHDNDLYNDRMEVPEL
jgi:Na+-translocating ferredoxin:NAD+ oxidoreductase RnfG subunit